MGSFSVLVLSRPTLESSASSQPPSPLSSSSSHPLSPAPSSLSSFALRKRSRAGGAPASAAGTSSLVRVLGLAYVAVSAIVFGRSCLRWLGAQSPVEASKVRRDASDDGKLHQVVFGSGAWVAEWERTAREKLGGWIAHQGGSRASDAEVGGVDRSGQELEGWDMEAAVRRKWSSGALTATTNPLTALSHPFRFSKMHAKLPASLAEEVEPFLFPALGGTAALGKGEITACMYTNDLWAPEILEAVKRWGGPVSLVWESDALRHPTTVEDRNARDEAIHRIARLRETDSAFRALVDVHLISRPTSLLEAVATRRRERMLLEPTATNQQLNIARFFARTSLVWLVGDARIVASHNLRVKLNGEAYKRQLLESGDALIVPTFGFLRPDLANEVRDQLIPSGEAVRAAASNTTSTTAWLKTAKAFVNAHRQTVSLAADQWPKTKRGLVALTSSAIVGMYEDGWDTGKGPTNWQLWRKPATDARLSDPVATGGGEGLGVGGRVGGGSALYRVTAYDLHYGPSVVIARQGQPWCTERFDENKPACTYQMYLTGAEMWVVPDEWAYTLKFIGNGAVSAPAGEAEKLKSSISSRLYTKFHQEACMHYGREFLSVDGWDSERARHLRAMCSKVLASWGVGVSGREDES